MTAGPDRPPRLIERALASIPDPRSDGAPNSCTVVPPTVQDPPHRALAQPPEHGEAPSRDQRAEDWVGLICVTLGLLAAVALLVSLSAHLVLWALR